jgi:hypothetical protein
MRDCIDWSARSAPAFRSGPVQEIQGGIDLFELVLEPVALLDRLRLFEQLDQLLLPRQQVLYDRAHKSPDLTPRASIRMFAAAVGSCGESHWNRSALTSRDARDTVADNQF